MENTKKLKVKARIFKHTGVKQHTHTHTEKRLNTRAWNSQHTTMIKYDECAIKIIGIQARKHGVQ